jgi:putative transcriptional regulator
MNMKNAFDSMMKGLDEVESYLGGNTKGFKAHVPETVNVKEIRHQLHMTQSKFSDCFGFSLDAVKHWEGGRRTPESSARAFLTVIAKNPEAVIAALHPHEIAAIQTSEASTSHHRRPKGKAARTTHA